MLASTATISQSTPQSQNVRQHRLQNAKIQAGNYRRSGLKKALRLVVTVQTPTYQAAMNDVLTTAGLDSAA